MIKSKIIKIENGTYKSKKDGSIKPFKIAWFTADKGLPCKAFCPEWAEEGMEVNVSVVPDFRCNASIQFEKI